MLTLFHLTNKFFLNLLLSFKQEFVSLQLLQYFATFIDQLINKTSPGNITCLSKQFSPVALWLYFRFCQFDRKKSDLILKHQTSIIHRSVQLHDSGNFLVTAVLPVDRLENNTTRHHPDKHLNSSFGFSLESCTHRSLSVNVTSLLIPGIPLLAFTLTSVWAATNSSLTRDVPKRRSEMWRCPEWLPKVLKRHLFYFWGAFSSSSKAQPFPSPLSDKNSLLSSSIRPHNSKSLTSLDSYPPVLPVKNHSNPEQTRTFYSHNIYLLFLIPWVLFTVKRFDFHPFFTCLFCCVAAQRCLRHFFSIARACCCSEISPWGRQSARETPHTWNTHSIMDPIDVF